MMRLAPRFALVLVPLLLALAPAVPAQATDDTISAYGMGALRTEWLAGGPDYIDYNGLVDLDLMGGNNIRLYRARFRQDRVMDSTGAYTDWRQLDNLVKQAANRGVSILPSLTNMPGANETPTPPRTNHDRSKFGDFAASAVRRYGPKGTFWTSCGCTARPIKAWEFWGDPNKAESWPPSPRPSEYGAALKVVRSKIRSADGTARIIFGSLSYRPPSASTFDANQFLRQVISSVGWRQFDAVPVEAYAIDNSATPQTFVDVLIKGTVDTLRTYAGQDASGAPRQQVWLAKIGTPTLPDDPATAEDERATSGEAQRAFLQDFLTRILAKRSQWNIGPLLWYTMRDHENPTPGDGWHRLGLRYTNPDTSDAGPKPAWTSFISYSQPAAPLSLPVPR